MRKILLVAALVCLSACSYLNKENLGMTKKAPNETMVEEKKPLSLPPEFDVRPQVVSEYKK